MLVVRVVDNGVGLQPCQNGGQARGMENMRFRAQLIRASLCWKENEEQSGTVVELRLRLKGKT
jgi:signal transduction histidine kinase